MFNILDGGNIPWEIHCDEIFIYQYRRYEYRAKVTYASYKVYHTYHHMCYDFDHARIPGKRNDLGFKELINSWKSRSYEWKVGWKKIQNIRTLNGRPINVEIVEVVTSLSISLITAMWQNIVMKKRGRYRFVNARFGSAIRSMRGIMTSFTRGLNSWYHWGWFL